ncbi:GNAT family N-acetyltransferase [Alistipes finegoldii]|uniref:GNAT family N-acetyltransferase n=1 Tax=Alistipes finegoldii TaxID=214856 RepID=UPI002665DB3D|nr:GNAT family N-acetyltransferase [Alistipes finegoldii]
MDVFHRFIAPEALTEQFRTGALMLWGAFRQDTLAGVAAVRNRSHISLLFVDASCHRQGIARALFNAVRDFCRTDPAVSRITVNSSPYAVEIYRRLGFTATDAERVTDGIRFTPMTYLL